MDSENEFIYSAEETTSSFKKEKRGIGKTAFISFIAGILGASLVVGICFGIPDIKNKILGNSNGGSNSSINFTTSSNNEEKVINISDYSNTSIAVSEKALPSVVGITVNYKVSSFIGQTAEAEAIGSGIIISEDGYIVTNNHVISAESSYYYTLAEATSITVNLYNDENLYEATVVGTDEYTDIAVLKIEKTGLTPATIGNSEKSKVGEMVFAIGNPVGMDYSVTSGIISALDREVEVDGTTYVAIQTDAAINSGNSGGALVNANGEVIGINTLKLSGTDIEGIGFAIPMASATDIIEQLVEYKTVKRPYVGLGGAELDSYMAQMYNLPVVGICVSTVVEGSPAEKAGIKAGDIVTKIEGVEVSTVNEFNKVKNKYNIGDTITLTIYRDNSEQEVKVVLEETPENYK